MHFLIEDDDLLEKHNTIWDKVSTDFKKEFDSKPVNNKKFLKTKIKFYGEQAIDFHDKEVPKIGSNCTCFAVISLDSAIKKEENYYPPVFLKDCKYIKKEKKMMRHITEDTKIFSNDSGKYEEEELHGVFLDFIT